MNPIIPSSQRPAPNSPWPNSRTVTTVMSVVLNIIFEAQTFSTLATVTGNIPTRAWRVVTAFQKQDYLQIAFEVAAFTALLCLPYGRLFAIGIDLSSECLNAYRHSSPPQRNGYSPRFTRIDPTIRENALKILDLSVEDARRSEEVEQQYKKIMEDLTRRKNRVSASPEAAAQIQFMIDDVHIAYKTLFGKC